MGCDVQTIREVPLFALLDDDEVAVLAEQVELAQFAPRQRIYRIDDPGDRAYVMISGSVQVTTIDEDHQDVVVDQPGRGEFFGFASMLDETPHQTNAIALEATTCVVVDRHDILTLLEKKPHAGMDMLAVLGRQLHASQGLVRNRATRNPNEMIESESTIGENIADAVASFGGSWTFIITRQLDVTSPAAYRPDQDVVRVKVDARQLPFSVETFTIIFANVNPSGCDMQMLWENTMATLPITTDVDTKVMAQIDDAMNKDTHPYFTAAFYYLENGKDLSKALEWFDKAIAQQPTAFFAVYQKARCQAKMGRKQDAIATAKKSIELSKQAKNDDYVALNEKLIASLQ